MLQIFFSAQDPFNFDADLDRDLDTNPGSALEKIDPAQGDFFKI